MKHFVLVTSIVFAGVGSAFGDELVESLAAADYVVSLQYEGASPTTADDVRRLYELGVAIAQSSNANSRNPKWTWDVSDILADYRRAADGRYLLITFAQPHVISSVGGNLDIKEILIGLNGSQYASSLHTIDSEGRVVGHAMYSGEKCIQMLELVQSMKRQMPGRPSGP